MTMGIKSRLLETMRTISLWGEREIRIGRVSILACDLSLSVSLMRKMSRAEMEMFSDTPESESKEVYSYGVVVEPFRVSLMGSDGDICWNSPGFDLANALSSALSKAQENDNWLNLGDLLVTECHIQGRYGVDYIFGDHGCPCLGKGLRFRDPTKSFCGEEQFIPQEGDGNIDYWQLSDNCHSVEIHREDAAEFVRRIQSHREWL